MGGLHDEIAGSRAADPEEAERVVEAMRAALDATVASAACEDACLGDEDVAGRRACVRRCREAGEAAVEVARALARPGGAAPGLERRRIDLCALACEACADECAAHAGADAACRRCEEACRRCARACRALLGPAD